MTCLHHSYLMFTKRWWIVITRVDVVMWLRLNMPSETFVCVVVCVRMCLLRVRLLCVWMCKSSIYNVWSGYLYLGLIPQLLIATGCRLALRFAFCLCECRVLTGIRCDVTSWIIRACHFTLCVCVYLGLDTRRLLVHSTVFFTLLSLHIDLRICL